MKTSARSILAIIAGITLSCSFIACEDTMSNGQTIVEDNVDIFIDTTLTATAKNIENNAIISRTVLGLLGDINAAEYGRLSSEIVAQFMPAISIDTAGVTVNDVDSIHLVMRYLNDGFIGDSIVPMGLQVYPLTAQLPSPIFSNFNPTDYYDKNTMYGSKIYTAARKNLPDSLAKLKYNEIQIPLPTDLGKKFFTEYIENPATFASPTEFAKFFPGLYIKNFYGSGRLTQIASTSINMYYHTTEKASNGTDSIIRKVGTYFAVTPEIICNNNITYAMAPELETRINNGENLLIGPIGSDIEITFPAKELIERYRQNIGKGLGIINTLSFSIPAEEITNKYGIAPPPSILMVLKNKKEEFFAQNKMVDAKTSFYSNYDEALGRYNFSNMLDYILNLAEKDEITPDDYTFIVTPVQISTEIQTDYYGNTTTVVTAITPYVQQPTMCRLLVDKGVIRFVYSRQTISF